MQGVISDKRIAPKCQPMPQPSASSVNHTVHAKLEDYVKFRDTTKVAVVEKLIVSQLFRKR